MKMACRFLFAAQLLLLMGVVQGQVETELAGNPLPGYPRFEFVTAFNENAPVRIGVDPTRFPAIVGDTADIFVVDSQSAWALGDPLIDAGAGAETFTFLAGGITANTLQVAGPLELASDAGIDIGVPYDVVIDLDQSGTLTVGDFLDASAGFYVFKDLTTPGPLAVTTVDDSVLGVTPGFDEERVYFPSDIGSMGQLPLVVISHGNGHQFTWYDYLGEHLASHGMVVMSHENNTGPGIETASTTILEHTDAFIGQLGSIGSGEIVGHLDTSRIAWIGHSRGGEGVARAYDRILDGFNPANYDENDIQFISSIAPTDFLGDEDSDPHGANYHLLYGGADGDVNGAASCDLCQSFHLLERATGFRSSTYVQGADHNDFNCCGFNDFSGPAGTQIGRAEAQRVTKAVYLAHLKHYLEGNEPAVDTFWRQYERFKPVGVQPSTIVVKEYKQAPSAGKLVIDDYETAPELTQSSSGGGVFSNLTDHVEGRLDDNNTSFTWTASDPFNGMTRSSTVTPDETFGTVFSVDATPGVMIWQVPPGSNDLSGFGYLSFRAAQGTRHPLTTARLGDENWIVALRDGSGKIAAINLAVYGGGIEEPYQRVGDGSGAGWQNEFETIRIRLTDFARGSGGVASSLDLTDIRLVLFLFLDTMRIGVDDLEVTLN